MIWESSYWKEDLIRLAEELERRKTQKRWSERSSARLEKAVMLGGYSIRKLIEANKFSTEIVERPVPLESFAWKGDPVTVMNWHKFDEKYDLDNPVPTEHPLLSVCNWLIHSYVFAPLHREDRGLLAILFNSDRTRHESLFQISVDQLIGLFAEVGRNDPASLRMERNPKTGDFDVWVGPTMEDA